MTVVADRFELGPVIAEGGGGVVHHAWDRQGACAVALKLLHPRGNPMDLLREVKTLADLQHPRIVRYVAYGTAPDRRTFIGTEWLEGETVAQVIKRGPLPIADVLDLVAAAADGLRVAHARGVVHRDIKPSNLFLVRGLPRDLKVIDFGIASTSLRLQGPDRGGMAGTPAYLSPEQARRAAVDSRADVFSLGCVMYECLTGQRPFVGTDVLVLLGKVQFEEVRPARELRPEVPAPVDRLLAAMVAKAPNRRPTMEEILATLADLGAAIRPRDPVPRADPPPATSEAGVALGLTDREERVWTVLMARAAEPTDPVETTDLVDAMTVEAAAAAAAAADGDGDGDDGPEILADGTPVLVFGDAPGEREPGAQAAARVALRLRASLPGAAFALATGRGQLIGRLPLGAFLDRAAQLLGVCLPGRVQIDDETARLVDDRFELTARFDAIELEREREGGARHTPREVLGRPTPFIGRDAEMARLERIADAALAGRTAQAVVITGEPGIGKSRLRHELGERLRRRRDRPEVALASGEPGTPVPVPLALARQLVQALAPATTANPEVDGGAGDDEEDPRAQFDRVREDWLHWLEERLHLRPVVLIVEDAHAADRGSLELLGAALGRLRAQPLLIVALARAGAAPPALAAWPEPCQRLLLEPLSPESCQALVAELLGRRAAADAVLAERSGGNPFFLEELIRARGAALPAPGADDLPDTVVAVVQARIDRLPSRLRRLLRAASVLPGGVDLPTLRAVLGEDHADAGGHGDGDLAAGLEALAGEELLVAGDHPAPAGGAPRYTFRNRIAQEATYATLTEGDRALAHRLAARWLAGRQAAPSEIASHFELAGDRPQAGPWYVRAAEQALAANDLDLAPALAERAARCGLRPDDLAAAKVVEARARFWRAQYLEAETAARRALRAAPAGSAIWYRSLSELLAALGERGEYAELERLLGQAQAQAPDGGAGAAAQRTTCLLTGAGYLAVSGRRQVARALLDAVAAPSTSGAAPPDDATQARIHSCRAVLAGSEGDAWGQSQECQRALELYERAGNVRRRCEMMGDLGSATIELGDLDRGIELLRQVVSDADRMRAPRLATVALVNLVQALAWRGRFDDAVVLAGTALDSAREQGNRRLEAGCFAFLAEAALLAGRVEEGERHARRALARTEGVEAIRPAVLAVLSWALLERGQAAEAAARSDEAMSLMQREGRPEVNDSMLHWVHARALAAAGDAPRAAAATRRAHERLAWRAERIDDPTLRAKFLDLPQNRRILALGDTP